jgi:hypothetical protein
MVVIHILTFGTLIKDVWLSRVHEKPCRRIIDYEPTRSQSLAAIPSVLRTLGVKMLSFVFLLVFSASRYLTRKESHQ